MKWELLEKRWRNTKDVRGSRCGEIIGMVKIITFKFSAWKVLTILLGIFWEVYYQRLRERIRENVKNLYEKKEN